MSAGKEPHISQCVLSDEPEWIPPLDFLREGYAVYAEERMIFCSEWEAREAFDKRISEVIRIAKEEALGPVQVEHSPPCGCGRGCLREGHPGTRLRDDLSPEGFPKTP